MTDTARALTTQEVQERREKVMQLEAALFALPPEQRVHLEPKHYFAPGIYLREMAIPRDVTLTGAIHKTEHYCILSKGKVSLTNGIDPAVTYEAPAIVHSMPGAKRAIYAHEDSVWVNVHHNPTDERDLEKIWDIYTAKSFDELGHAGHGLIEGGK